MMVYRDLVCTVRFWWSRNVKGLGCVWVGQPHGG